MYEPCGSAIMVCIQVEVGSFRSRKSAHIVWTHPSLQRRLGMPPHSSSPAAHFPRAGLALVPSLPQLDPISLRARLQYFTYHFPPRTLHPARELVELVLGVPCLHRSCNGRCALDLMRSGAASRGQHIRDVQNVTSRRVLYRLKRVLIKALAAPKTMPATHFI